MSERIITHIPIGTDSMSSPTPQVKEILNRTQVESMDVVGQTGPMDPPSKAVREVLRQFGFQK